MDGMLSQEEINALLKGMDDESQNPGPNVSLTDQEKDAIGEVSNISMGTAATTLSSLVNDKVLITTPKVSVCQWDDLATSFSQPFVAIQIIYKVGLTGSNVLMLKEQDVKIISDLMMGGDGSSFEGELNELHLSAISEAMNQMIGSSATSMSSMFGKKIDINPPVSTYIDNNEIVELIEVAEFVNSDFIKVDFEMKIGELIDSEIMQLYPLGFAKEICESFLELKDKEESIESQIKPQVDTTPQMGMPPQMDMQQQTGMSQQMGIQQQMGMPQQMNPYRNIDVQHAQFQNLDMGNVIQQKENIDLIMDVPLGVTVELGRTHKTIKEILEFAPGTIVELNKLAGEPIDVLVNGKIVAKGEVVVIDENFGIRITDIIKQKNLVI